MTGFETSQKTAHFNPGRFSNFWEVAFFRNHKSLCVKGYNETANNEKILTN